MNAVSCLDFWEKNGLKTADWKSVAELMRGEGFTLAFDRLNAVKHDSKNNSYVALFQVGLFSVDSVRKFDLRCTDKVAVFLMENAHHTNGQWFGKVDGGVLIDVNLVFMPR